MSIAYFNVANRKLQPKLWLCKPNKQIISPLLDIYNLELHTRLSAISEMTFSIPVKVERNHELVDNPLLNKIKDRYYVKMVYENQTEYFVFLKQNKQISSDGKSVTYHLYSTAYLLNDKFIYKLEETGWTLRAFANEILKETSWRLDTVDGHYEVTERYMDISAKTVLESLFELAKTFNAIILFNTTQETVSFYNPNNIGLNKGLKIKDTRFLESLNVETKADEMITRLYVYGKDGLSIRKLTATGADYIEDFSYFMHPFECDDNYNVIKSSEYMSDNLCVAIVKYRNLLEANAGRLDVYNSNLKTIQTRITTEEQQMSVLKTELNTLEDERDVINATYGEAALERDDHREVIAKINAKNIEIRDKFNSLTQLYTQEEQAELQIKNLNKSLGMENSFTPSELMELNKYIITKEHTNDGIVEEEDLLKEAFEVFETLNEPPIDINLSIEGYLESLQNGSQVQKIALGDIVRVEDKDLALSYRLKILEIHFNFEELSINLTIANGKDVLDDNAKLVDLIYSANNTSTIVNMDKFKWNLAVTANDSVSRLLNSEWDAVKNAIMGGYNQTITISNRGLVAKDITDPMNWLVLQNGVLAITNDNGNSWKTAITKNGMFAERLVGKILIGNKLHIEDEEGIITITGGSQKVFDLNGNVRVELGRYVDSADITRYGLRIHSGAIEIIDGLPSSQIENGAVTRWDSAESNAKAYADALKAQTDNEIGDLLNELDDFKDVISDSFMDGIIEQSEAIAIQKYIHILNSEKKDVERRYDLIVNDVALSSTIKTALMNTKIAFDNAHTQLITSINNAIADLKTDSAEKEDVNEKFTLYSSALADFSEALTLAISDIQMNRISTSEQNAKDYAYQLKTQIDNEIADVSNELSEFKGVISTTFMDGIIEQSEAIAIQKYINSLNTEKADIERRYNLIVNDTSLSSTLKTKLTTDMGVLNNSHTQLITSINNAIADRKTTSTEKADVDEKFATYSSSLIALSETLTLAIADIETNKISSAEQNAKDYADSLMSAINEELGDVNERIERLDDFLDDALLDGIVDASELKAIESYINVLRNEKADVDAQYVYIYSVYDLPATNKSNLESVKRSYDTAFNNLLSTITSVIGDGKVTDTEKTNIDTAFSNYRTASANLKTAFESCIDAITTARAANAEKNVKDHLESILAPIITDLGDVMEKMEDLDGFLEGAMLDGIIDRAEAKTIEAYIQLLRNEKADVDAQYAYIYDISILPATNKSNLQSVKSSYNTAFNNVISAITNAIEDGKVTSAEKGVIDTRFETYRTASANLKTAFETCIDVIMTARAQEANSGIRNDLRLTAPLPTSISLNANGITASTSNSNNFARLDYRGLYVQGGAVDIRTGASTNAGVIINGTGIKGYNSSGANTFNVDAANGRVTIQGSFTLQNRSGTSNVIRIDESGIYAYNAAGGSSFQLTTSGNAYFSGTIEASNITGASIVGGSLSGTTLSALNIEGGTISGTTITGATIRTSENQVGSLHIDGTGLSLYDYEGARTVHLTTMGIPQFYGDVLGRTILALEATITDLNATKVELYSTTITGSLKFSPGTNVNFTGANVTGLQNNVAVFG